MKRDNYNGLIYERDYHTCRECGVSQREDKLRTNIMPPAETVYTCKDTKACERYKTLLKLEQSKRKLPNGETISVVPQVSSDVAVEPDKK